MLGFGDIPTTKIEIFTNSLSGSDAFCRMPANKLRQEQVHLFGGAQIEKYRAVLGEVTINAMNTVNNSYKKNGLIIGIITANWLLVGNGYRKLILCSTEQVHLQYKKRLAEIADILIIASPLGKLLKLDTPSELNTILRLREDRKPEYEGFAIDSIPNRNHENTILITTFRNNKKSILYHHSKNLRASHDDKKHKKYRLTTINNFSVLDYRLDRENQIEIEMPHQYLREHSYRVLQIA